MSLKSSRRGPFAGWTVRRWAHRKGRRRAGLRVKPFQIGGL